MKRKSLDMMQFVLLSSAVLAALAVGTAVFYYNLMGNLQASTCQTLDEVIEQEKTIVTQKLNYYDDEIKSFAQLIVPHLDDEQGLRYALSTMSKNTSFNDICYANLSGQALRHDGTYRDVSSTDYFAAALSGETVMSDPIQDEKNTHEVLIAMASPVVRGEKLVGVLMGFYRIHELDKLLQPTFGGCGYAYITTSQGACIAKTPSSYTLSEDSNLFAVMGRAHFKNTEIYEQMCSNLKNSVGGHANFVYEGQKRMLHYTPLFVNDWVLLSAVAPDDVQTVARKILLSAVVLTSFFVLTLLALLFYMFVIQKKFTWELSKLAYVDTITGARNFSKFKMDAIELIKNNSQTPYVMVKMDMKHFKLVNEIYSFETGNRVLQTMATALAEALDSKLDAFGRISADEFVALVSYETEEKRLQKRKIFRDALYRKCKLFIDFKIELSMGRYRLEKGETDFIEIYEKVNFAHNLAKDSDDEEEVDYDSRVKTLAIQAQEITNIMDLALQKGEFVLYLQPKYRLQDRRMVGAEALVRWIPENGNMIFPDTFIPVFEQNGFINKLDFHMFEQACQVLHTWITGGIEPITISVNFSRMHLSNPHFVAEMVSVCEAYHIPHALLEIELTETTLFDHIDVLKQVLDEIHEAGFTLSMDDFGTGYSSLGLLKSIPVDVIKIDKSFFDDSNDRVRGYAIILSVLEMAKRLHIQTVAEGIETQEQIDLLDRLGCDVVQGYYFAKPMPAEDICSLLSPFGVLN